MIDLRCGDSLEVLRQLEAESVDCVSTDPPYCSGGRQQASARNLITKSDREDAAWFMGDNMGTDTYLWWMRQIARECLRVALPGAQAQVFTDWRQYTTIVTAWESVGWTLRNVVVWDKAKGGAMGSYWRNNHEWAAVFSKGKPRPLAHRSCFNTWTGSKPQGGAHPTEKPVALMEYLLGTVAQEDEAPPVILDPFMGSGTTGVAAARLGYGFVGIDHDPAYVKVARDRIANTQPALAA